MILLALLPQQGGAGEIHLANHAADVMVMKPIGAKS